LTRRGDCAAFEEARARLGDARQNVTPRQLTPTRWVQPQHWATRRLCAIDVWRTIAAPQTTPATATVLTPGFSADARRRWNLSVYLPRSIQSLSLAVTTSAPSIARTR